MHIFFRYVALYTFWASAVGTFLGALLDAWARTSILFAPFIGCVACVLASIMGFQCSARKAAALLPKTNFPSPLVRVRKQHGTMWSLMGAMTGGTAGGAIGGPLGHLLVIVMSTSDTMSGDMGTSMQTMDFMNLSMMGAMVGMIASILGVWFTASREGFVGNEAE